MPYSGGMLGRTLGHYRVLEEIGAGGMGVVYKAGDERLQREVALKILPEGTLTDEAARRRFRKEAVTLAQLNHPNIAIVHDFDTQEGIDFLVLEYIDGTTLSDKLASGPLAEKDVIRLAAQLALGLAAAHEKGVVHRDLKPGNLRVTPDGLLKILDFGLATLRRPHGGESETETAGEVQAVAGTLPYMSPEQLRGEAVDARADIYSVGAVLYEMATGRRAFPQDRGPQLIAAILQQAPQPPSAVSRRISPELEHIILKALDKDAERRYQSARELLVDLNRLTPTVTATAPATAVPRRTRSRRFRAAGVALAVLLLAALAIPGVRTPLLRWAGVSQVPGQRNLAVLPFQAIGGGADNQAYCDGLTETLTARLVRLTTAQSLQVAPASEVRARRVASAQSARAEFGANLVLQGSVHRFGETVRINYALFDTRTLRQLHSETQNWAASDPFAVQDRLADDVARILELEFRPGERRRPATHGTRAVGANNYYLQGRGYLQNYNDKQEWFQDAIGVFERALELDPDHAPAHAGLGEAYLRKYDAGKEPVWVEKGRQACEKAAALDPKLAAAHICLGMLHNTTGQYEKAVSEFRRVLESEPTNDDAHRGLARSYERLGKPDEAEQTYRAAIAVRPHYWGGYSWLGAFYVQQARYREAGEMFARVIAMVPDGFRGYSNLGAVYISQDRHADAIAVLERSIRIRPGAAAYNNLGVAYYHLRRFAEAVGAAEESVKLNERDTLAWGNLGLYYSRVPGKRAQAGDATRKAIHLARDEVRLNPRNAVVLGRLAVFHARVQENEEAQKVMERALALTPASADLQIKAATVYSKSGEVNRALEWLEKGLAAGYSATRLRDDPDFDGLRGDARFQKLVGIQPR